MVFGNLNSKDVPRNFKSPTAATNCIRVILIEGLIPNNLRRNRNQCIQHSKDISKNIYYVAQFLTS